MEPFLKNACGTRVMHTAMANEMEEAFFFGGGEMAVIPLDDLTICETLLPYRSNEMTLTNKNTFHRRLEMPLSLSCPGSAE